MLYAFVPLMMTSTPGVFVHSPHCIQNDFPSTGRFVPHTAEQIEVFSPFPQPHWEGRLQDAVLPLGPYFLE